MEIPDKYKPFFKFVVYSDKPTIDDIASKGNLLAAHTRAREGKTTYYSVHRVDLDKDKYLDKLHDLLMSGEYRSTGYTQRILREGTKERVISKAHYYPDRIVHWALMLHFEPLFMQVFSPHTHAAIFQRGIHSALKDARMIIKEKPNYKYVLKMDIKKYFQHIDHEILKDMLKQFTRDKKVLAILYNIIDTFDEGIPIGNYTSQYFANLYLTPLDRFITAHHFFHIRYMDDIVIFSPTKELLHELFDEMKQFIENYLHLTIKENYQIFPIDARGIDFVGYRIFPNRVLVRKSTLKVLVKKLTKIKNAHEEFRRKNPDGYRYDRLTSTEIGVLASYAGWVVHCTPKVRKEVFMLYFSPLTDLFTNIPLPPKPVKPPKNAKAAEHTAYQLALDDYNDIKRTRYTCKAVKNMLIRGRSHRYYADISLLQHAAKEKCQRNRRSFSR